MQIGGRFRLLARRGVLESHQNPALRMAWQRQRVGVENQRALTLPGKDVIHLNGLERTAVGQYRFELRTQRGKFQEQCVEGAIARMYSLVCVEHHDWVGDSVEDRLSALAFI